MVTRYSYFPDRHEVFKQPPEPTSIWRYMTLPKLLMLLGSEKLFFCRASKFPDRFEGAIPKLSDQSLKAWEAQHMGPEASARSRAERMRAREIVVINCWQMLQHESSAMWSLYGKGDEGVAIRSTFGRLIGALPQRLDAKDQGWETIFVGKVDYIDYATATFPPHNSYYPFVHKRQDFKHENEIRAMTMISDAARDAATAGVSTEFEVDDMGLYIPVNVGALIESIYVSPMAPKAFESIVCTALERFGFGTIKVLSTRLSMDAQRTGSRGGRLRVGGYKWHDDAAGRSGSRLFWSGSVRGWGRPSSPAAMA